MEIDSLAKYFSKLDFTSRAVIVSIAILMPFWYIAMSVFDWVFISKNQLYVASIFCFCFSIIWYILHFSIFIYAEGEDGIDIKGRFILCGVSSIFGLSALLLGFYILKHSLDRPITFYLFLLVSYGVLLLTVIFKIIYFLKSNK